MANFVHRSGGGAAGGGVGVGNDVDGNGIGNNLGVVRWEGFLVKRTMKSGRNWKKRYFVLDGTTLWYFRSEGDVKPRGEIHITSNTFIKTSHFKQHAMELSTNRQVLIICAENASSQQKWLQMIEKSIQLARAQREKFMKDRSSNGCQDSKKRSNKGFKQQKDEDMGVDSDFAGQEEESKTSSVSSRSRASGLFKKLKKHRRRASSSSMNSMESGPKSGNSNNANGFDYQNMVEPDNTSDPMEQDGNTPQNSSMETGETHQYFDAFKSNHQMAAAATTTTTTSTEFGAVSASQAFSSSSSSSSSKFSIGSSDLKPRPTHKFSTPTTTFEVDVRYSFIRPVGTGAYGVVVSAHDKKSKEQVAIKKVTRAFEDLVDAKRILREIKLLRHFDHENIIHIKDLLSPKSYNDFEDIYIVSELMETDLHRVIYSKQKLTEDHIQYFVYQTLRALKYIHSANVIHRDLKPSNLLLNSNCDLKVCDFGLARGLDSQLQLTEYVVTRWYRAPEVMLACRNYSKAIDVWSLGCIFAELLQRKPLFPGEDYIHQLQLITDVIGTPSEEDMSFITSSKAKSFMRNQPLRPKRRFSGMFPKASAECLDLLDKMLQFNPAKRITVETALEHPYLATLHQPEDEPTCPRVFDFDDNIADDELRKRDIQDQILQEALLFHPEDRQRFLFEAANHVK